MLHVKMDNSIMLPSVEIPNLNLQNAGLSFFNNSAKVFVLKFQN